MTNRGRRAQGGFTLFELVVVMIVIGVAAAIVAPSFASFFPSLKTRKAAEGLVAAARKARADAALTMRRVRLVAVSAPADGEAPAHHLVFEADPLTTPGVFRKMPGGWGLPERLPEDVTFESLEGAADGAEGEKIYEFRPDGTATEGAIVVAHPKGDRVTVRIAGTTGAVTVEEKTE